MKKVTELFNNYKNVYEDLINLNEIDYYESVKKEYDALRRIYPKKKNYQ